MKVTHIIVALDVGGAELMLKRLVEELNNRDGMQHSIISLKNLGPVANQLNDAGIKVTALGMKNTFSVFSTFFKLRQELKEQKPDIVQTWMYHADFLGGLASRSVGIDKIIWNVRNTYLTSSGKLNFIFRKSCAFLSSTVPHEIIYVSYSAQREHLKAGYTHDKGVVIGNGFDTNKYAFNTDHRAKYRKELDLKSNEIAVFSVGRCIPAKDHQTFVKAICEASKANKNIKGVLIGRNLDLDSFLLSEYQKKSFIVLGERENISQLLSAADVFCLHSITEGFPNVLGEAMSVGLPCITTKAGDAELILSNKKYTVETGDFSSMAKLMVELSKKSTGFRKDIGKENRQKVLNYFSLQTILNKYLTLYKK